MANNLIKRLEDVAKSMAGVNLELLSIRMDLRKLLKNNTTTKRVGWVVFRGKEPIYESIAKSKSWSIINYNEAGFDYYLDRGTLNIPVVCKKLFVETD